MRGSLGQGPEGLGSPRGSADQQREKRRRWRKEEPLKLPREDKGAQATEGQARGRRWVRRKPLGMRRTKGVGKKRAAGAARGRWVGAPGASALTAASPRGGGPGRAGEQRSGQAA